MKSRHHENLAYEALKRAIPLIDKKLSEANIERAETLLRLHPEAPEGIVRFLALPPSNSPTAAFRVDIKLKLAMDDPTREKDSPPVIEYRVFNEETNSWYDSPHWGVFTLH